MQSSPGTLWFEKPPTYILPMEPDNETYTFEGQDGDLRLASFLTGNLFKGSHTGSTRPAKSPSAATLLAPARKHTLTRLQRQCLRRLIDRHHRHDDNEGSGESSDDGGVDDYTPARCTRFAAAQFSTFKMTRSRRG